MKQLIMLSIVLIGCCLNAGALGAQEATMYTGQEAIHITLLLNQTCGEKENIFRIERANYTTGIAPLELSYLLCTTTPFQKTSCEEFTKTINKYTYANTGYVLINTSETYQLNLTLGNNTTQWYIQGNCTYNASSNITSNQTLPEINKSNSTTTNTTTPQNVSLHNESTQLPEEQTNNTTTTDKNQTENNTSTNTTTEEPTCFSFFEIYSDKDIYTTNERAEIQFYLRPISDSFTITYWISDLDGNIVKKPYTTTNLHKKSYTFKEIEQAEKGYQIIAQVNDSCSSVQKEKLVIVTQNKATNAEEKTISENITIQEIAVEKEQAIISLFIARGESRKSVIYCKFTDQSKRRVQDDVYIKLLSHQQEVQITIPFQKKEEERILFSCEGLGVYTEQEILFAYTKENKTTSTTTNNSTTTITTEENKSQEKKEIAIETLVAGNLDIDNSTNHQLTGFSVSSPDLQKEKKARNLSAIILGSILITLGLLQGIFALKKRIK